MERAQQLADLRELFLNAPEENATRLVAVTLSFALLATVLWLVRRRGLREEYTPIWVCTAIGILAVALRLDVLSGLTRLIGAWAPSSTIFFLADLFLLAICLNYAVRLSRAGVQVKNLAQELALLRERLDRLAPPSADGPRA